MSSPWGNVVFGDDGRISTLHLTRTEGGPLFTAEQLAELEEVELRQVELRRPESAERSTPTMDPGGPSERWPHSPRYRMTTELVEVRGTEVAAGDARAPDLEELARATAKAGIGAGLSTPEPDPIPNDSTPSWDLVIEDMKTRDNEGRAKYGTPLQAGNGRDSLVDAYQEALDLVVYLRTVIAERVATSGGGLDALIARELGFLEAAAKTKAQIKQLLQAERAQRSGVQAYPLDAEPDPEIRRPTQIFDPADLPSMVGAPVTKGNP